MAAPVLHDDPVRTGSTAVYPYSDALANQFTLQPKFEDDGPLHLWEREGGEIHLPRASCPWGEDHTVEGQAIAFNCTAQPRDAEQARLFREVSGALVTGKSGVLQAQTGIGKTVIALKAIADTGRLPLVIVADSDLLESWRNEAKQHLGLRDDEIGVIRQDSCDVEGKKFLIGMLPSLAKWREQPERYPQWLFDAIGVVVWDECHRLAADTFRVTAGMFPARRRLGLSATPKRVDGKEPLIFAHIGPILARGQIEQMVPTVVRVQSPWRCPRKNGRKIDHDTKKNKHVAKHIMKCHANNALLADILYSAWRKGRHSVLFSDFLGHLDDVRERLIEKGVPEGDTDKYVGGKSAKQLAKAAQARVIFATYSMMSEGTDIPTLDACVLATPRANVEQVVGRIRRVHPDKKDPVVVDMRYPDSPVFKLFDQKRDKFYRQIGASIQDSRP